MICKMGLSAPLQVSLLPLFDLISKAEHDTPFRTLDISVTNYEKLLAKTFFIAVFFVHAQEKPLNELFHIQMPAPGYIKMHIET